jgi:hypothetical protein
MQPQILRSPRRPQDDKSDEGLLRVAAQLEFDGVKHFGFRSGLAGQAEIARRMTCVCGSGMGRPSSRSPAMCI